MTLLELVHEHEHVRLFSFKKRIALVSIQKGTAPFSKELLPEQLLTFISFGNKIFNFFLKVLSRIKPQGIHLFKVNKDQNNLIDVVLISLAIYDFEQISHVFLRFLLLVDLEKVNDIWKLIRTKKFYSTVKVKITFNEIK